MFEIIDAIGNRIARVIANKTRTSNQVELHEFLSCFTTDSISQVAFGFESNSLEDSDSAFRKHGKQIVELSAFDFLKFFFTSSFPELSRTMRITANKRSVIKFFHDTFTENIKKREESNVVRKDFMQILLDLKKTTSLTISELAAESFIFFLGGFETSSSLSVFTIYELAQNQEIQERLRQEIASGLKENEGKLTYDLLFSFKYLDMIVNEGLRKYPIAYLIMRKTTKDFKIPNTEMTIPAGTNVNINVLSIHRDPEYYPNPDKFDPERFSPENVRNRKPFTFIPFGKFSAFSKYYNKFLNFYQSGDGPRKCIGGRFGVLQAKIAIVKLVANFEISPNSLTTVPMKFSPTALFLAPINKMWLTLKPIEETRGF